MAVIDDWFMRHKWGITCWLSLLGIVYWSPVELCDKYATFLSVMSSIALYDIIADVGLVIKITRYVRANRISENLVGQAAIRDKFWNLLGFRIGVLDSWFELRIHCCDVEIDTRTWLKTKPELVTWLSTPSTDFVYFQILDGNVDFIIRLNYSTSEVWLFSV